MGRLREEIIIKNQREIEVLYGALAMQQYNSKLDMKNECLDFSHHIREYVEFLTLPKKSNP